MGWLGWIVPSGTTPARTTNPGTKMSTADGSAYSIIITKVADRAISVREAYYNGASSVVFTCDGKYQTVVYKERPFNLDHANFGNHANLSNFGNGTKQTGDEDVN